MSRHNRRDFLKRAAAGGLAAATFAVAGTKTSGRVLGANDRVRIAVAGINGRGQEHIHAYCEMKNVEIAYLVDPDSRLFASRSEWIKDHGGGAPQCVAGPPQGARRQEPGRRLDRLAEPLARAAGDLGLPGGQGRVRGEAVLPQRLRGPQAGRGGAEVRPHRPARHAEPLRSVLDRRRWRPSAAASTAGCWSPTATPASRGGASASSWPKQPPKELDFNLWLGPAPQQPYHENLVHYNWHWFWDFGNGEIGNQGVHQMDIARWAMPDGAAPKGVVSLGGRFGYRRRTRARRPTRS